MRYEMRALYFILFTIITFTNSSSSSSTSLNVVMYAIPHRGHINALLPLGDELVRRGHHVSFVIFDNMKSMVCLFLPLS